MGIRIFQVDAFTATPFRGNPAAVCLLDGPRRDAWMQSVAAEMNLSETAFVEPAAAGWSLRWFTPTTEVSLCGHATLASAHVLWETGALRGDDAARFHTRSGMLSARRFEGARIEIDLPAAPVTPMPPPEAALEALGGVRVVVSGRTSDRGLGDVDFLFELGSEAAVRGLRPDFGQLALRVPAGIIVTARAEERRPAAADPSGNAPERYDFVSRYFAPAFGIDEDAVTGAAHCALAPYWSERLGRDALMGYQASRRGGFVGTRVAGARVLLSGEAVTVMRGTLLP